MTHEEALDGGNASGTAVVRIGETVRKPWSASTASVVAFVEALRSAGIDAPAPLGRDAEVRQVQEVVPGTLAIAWDSAYSAQAFRLSDTSGSPRRAADDLAAFVDGYRADARMRQLLPDAMAERTAAMYELLRTSHETGDEPWASMFTAGHGDHWASADDYPYLRGHSSV